MLLDTVSPITHAPTHRPAGAPLQKLHVDDARELELPAPGRGQGTVFGLLTAKYNEQLLKVL